MNLSLLEPGHIAIIEAIDTDQGLEQRLQALGFRQGREITLIRRAWFSGPLHVRIGTTEVMVRRREAERIYLQEISQNGALA
ncbi:MAG: FeoA family protein [Prochloraceae cyanobacterium]|nr:FeoA family protein [Prochloraceae cyanobacterium]